MTIYCGKYGHPNDPASKFCEVCGEPLTAKNAEERSMVAEPQKSKKWISRLSSMVAGLIILFFFLPWVSVSCNYSLLSSQKIKASGYQLASGDFPLINKATDITSLVSGYDIGSDQINEIKSQASTPVLWMVLVLGIIGIFCLLGGKAGGAISLIVGFLGIIFLISLASKLSTLSSQIQMMGFKINTEPALVMEWLGFILLIVIGIIALIYKPRQVST